MAKADLRTSRRRLGVNWSVALPNDDAFEVRRCIQLVEEEALERGLTLSEMLAWIFRKRYGLPSISPFEIRARRKELRSAKMLHVWALGREKVLSNQRAMKMDSENALRAAAGMAPKGELWKELTEKADLDPRPVPAKKGTPLQ